MFGMPSGRPTWRAFQFLAVTFGLAEGYILFGSYLNWPPFFRYPSVGSPQFILIWIVAIFAAWFIDFARFAFVKKKDGQIEQSKVR